MPHVTPLISREQIAAAVAQLGARLSRDYAGQDLTVIGVLTGSIVFVADLMREIAAPHQVGFIQASSYRGAATSPGELRINFDFLPDVAGRQVLLVDDIFDTGRTLSAIVRQLSARGPASIRTAVLLWKEARSQAGGRPDEFCFRVPDEFVVGYGLDYNGEHRHLPFIGVLADGPRSDNIH